MADSSSKSSARITVRFFKYAIMILVVIVCATVAFNFGTAVFSNDGVEPKSQGSDINITVPKGTDIEKMGDMLEDNSVIKDSTVFRVQAWLYGVKKVKPGKYVFNNSQGGEEIFNIIKGGPNTTKKSETEEDLEE